MPTKIVGGFSQNRYAHKFSWVHVRKTAMATAVWFSRWRHIILQTTTTKQLN